MPAANEEAEDLVNGWSPSFQAITRDLAGCSHREVEHDLEAVLAVLAASAPPGIAAAVASRLPADLAGHWPASGRSCPEPPDSLVAEVAKRLPRGFPAHACLLVRVVLAALASGLGVEDAAEFAAALPHRWRKLWPKEVWSVARSRSENAREAA